VPGHAESLEAAVIAHRFDHAYRLKGSGVVTQL
jgi:hypothetical protein